MTQVLFVRGGRPQLAYVGGYTESFVGLTSDKTISLTGLTGGLASAPATGDFVIVAFSAADGSGDVDLVVAGYDERADIVGTDSYFANLAVATKFMTASPDTSVVLTGGTGHANNAGAVSIQVWRYVDQTTPMDVTVTTATGGNTILADPAAITPVSVGAQIIVAAAGAGATLVDTYTAGYLSNFLTSWGDDTNDAVVGMGNVAWTSGAYNPAAFGTNGTDNSAFSWAAVTMALRPLHPR